MFLKLFLFCAPAQQTIGSPSITIMTDADSQWSPHCFAGATNASALGSPSSTSVSTGPLEIFSSIHALLFQIVPIWGHVSITIKPFYFYTADYFAITVGDGLAPRRAKCMNVSRQQPKYYRKGVMYFKLHISFYIFVWLHVCVFKFTYFTSKYF